MHAEQARLGAVGNDLASDLVKIYREIYELSESILRLEVEAGKLDRDLRVAQSQQQQGIATPLTAIDAELALVGKQEELEIDRVEAAPALRRTAEGHGRHVEVDSMKQSQRIVKNAFFGIASSVIGGRRLSGDHPDHCSCG